MANREMKAVSGSNRVRKISRDSGSGFRTSLVTRVVAYLKGKKNRGTG